MPPADNTPDFDSMSPEEMMAWMESLAKRQGVQGEELTTSADIEVPEYDPETTVIDEPGYVPYGEERPAKPETPAAPKQPAAQAPPPVEPPAPAAAPPAAPPPVAPPPVEPPAPQPVAPAAQQPEPEDAGGLSWLESLAADQGTDMLDLDLSALTDDTDTVAPIEEQSPTDTLAWLQGLSDDQGEIPPAAPPVETPPPAPQFEQPPAAAELPTDQVTDPFASGVDPIAWLENLARRQNASIDEMTTDVQMDIPEYDPNSTVVDEPGYVPFSPDSKAAEPQRPPKPETPPPVAEPEPEADAEPVQAELNLESPTNWLESLAADQGFDENIFTQQTLEQPAAPTQQPQRPTAEAGGMSIAEIEQAIAAGNVTPEQMQYYLEHQTDKIVEDYSAAEPQIPDPDAPPVPADFPDWLVEQIGPPQIDTEDMVAGMPPPLVDEIVERPDPDVDDMPDWLKADIPSENNLDNIFVLDEEEPTAPPPPPPAEPDDSELDLVIEVDPNDPWVNAFEAEHARGGQVEEEIPDWYRNNLNNPDRIAAVERLAGESAAEDSATAELPEETVLPAGEPTALPGWLQDVDVATEELPSTPDFIQQADAEPAEEMPDWLMEAAVDVEPEEVPDWLRETLDTEPEPAAEGAFDFISEPLASTPGPTPPPRPTQPTPPPVVSVDASATLNAARTQVQSGNIDASLSEYDKLIRASAQLDTVVSDLRAIAQQQQNNPAVYRVLGDGLMRQGKLQDALDIYRTALNQI